LAARYFLPPGAVDDIREIGDWSLQRWGKEKAVQYLTELHEGLEYIAANFKIFENNKTREDLGGGLWPSALSDQQALSGIHAHW
jgi:plasmid stabilization system protein ParE